MDFSTEVARSLKGSRNNGLKGINKRTQKNKDINKSIKTVKSRNNKDIARAMKDSEPVIAYQPDEPPREELPYTKFFPDLDPEEQLLRVYASDSDSEIEKAEKVEKVENVENIENVEKAEKLEKVDKAQKSSPQPRDIDEDIVQEDEQDQQNQVDSNSKPYQRPEGHYLRYNEPDERILADRVEYDMDEQDDIWLKALNYERKKEDLGELGADLFEKLIDRLEKAWFDLTKNLPKGQGDKDNLTPEDSACAICDDGECENSNAIVFCDGYCYGIPYIPEGQWLCRKCIVSPETPSCIFCPNEGGAFKKTNTNRWAHLLCALWIPEVGLSNTVYMEPIDNIEGIPRACIQCQNAHCCTAFHVTCARKAKLCMRMKFPDFHNESYQMKAYCDKHTPRDYKEQVDVTTTVIAAQKLLMNDDVPVSKKKGQSSKSARAYNHSYSETAPIAPAIIIDKLLPILSNQKGSIKKKQELVATICKYWSLKRESRPSAHKQSDKEKFCKFMGMRQLRKDLEKIRLLIDCVHRREKAKLKRNRLITQYLETVLFPLDYILSPVIEEIISHDKQEIFVKPVTEDDAPDYSLHIKHPMDLGTIKKKIETHEYSLGPGMQEFENAMTYNTSNTVYYRNAKRMYQLCKPIVEKAKRDYAGLQVDPKKGILNVKIHPEVFTYNSKPLIFPQKEKEITKSSTSTTSRSNRSNKKEVDGTSSSPHPIHKTRETRSTTAAKRKKNKRSLTKEVKPKAPKGTRSRNQNQTVPDSQPKIIKGNVGRFPKTSLQRPIRGVRKKQSVKPSNDNLDKSSKDNIDKSSKDNLDKPEKSINDVVDKPEVSSTESSQTYPDEKYKVIKEQLENTLKVVQEESEKPAASRTRSRSMRKNDESITSIEEIKRDNLSPMDSNVELMRLSRNGSTTSSVVENHNITYGTLVWAKMTGFPCPEVTDTIRSDKKEGDSYLVHFFDEKKGKRRSWKWVPASKVALIGDPKFDIAKIKDRTMKENMKKEVPIAYRAAW
ncbi:9056_t:CDS:10 [Diversispora eburnea]|uniref:9056_t:CDS:1 n=1 Tax=Diversispora eburnea TaxID=1213867 RepID=A0A9N9BW05_9GLOM|nr:9056_t:CDS:10 [Diversispora eburnea]